MSDSRPALLPLAPPRRPAPVVAEVVRTERLTPHLARVVLGGPGLHVLTDPTCADSYVKLGFLPTGALDGCPLTDDGRVDAPALRASLPEGVQVRQRAYTIRAWDAVAREMTLDFVVHGDEGVAGPWSVSTTPGDRVLVHGPGGAWDPRTDVDVHLLVGDASALPAVAVGLERLPRTAVGAAFVEVHGPQDEIALDAPAGVEVTWLHHGDAPAGSTLPEAVRAWPTPAGRIGAFVHGEAGAVKELRAHLRTHGVARGDLSISGYWRLGADDESWRASKKAWNAQIEASEAAAGLD
ncbi:siderophore-interacting protein [Cellulomonas wangsupingiae]|uniref:Siderophore-interacting protein n=1 Tax=Cellulomonas wangsupingiae TaxID=2968085 RepID=A0ABY5K9H5_9CELL|nr:siderophore-interacting protein [Cellulomonas wangsupingiae]MCC2334371.1 siderophore-interacting protein [Cellulomonas wangsupingiae]MCM0640756.1 siderophore-interacting protein [Cellulomonas wangsupingiae]UUI66041.1 siderophore-interacting protein [Cellulomonas wangsupingiae]